MPDGQLRRPPQLWEQRLSRTTSVIAAGVGGGEATAIVAPTPPPGAGGGTEPAPVAPAPRLFISPSAPTLLKQVQAINVLWDGLNSAGELWPYDTSWVEIHMSTSAAFTAGSATLKGRLTRPGIYSVGGLSSGTTYYFKLRGADPAGNYTSASTEVSSTTGSASSSDIISISADKVTAGTVTGLYIGGGTIAGGYLSGGTISGGFITGGTVQGAVITTSSFNPRVALNDGGGRAAYLDIFSSNNAQHSIYGDLGDLVISPSSRLKVGTSVQIQGDLSFVGSGNGDITAVSLDASGLVKSATLEVSGAAVDMIGVYNNNTTGIDNVGITTAGRLRRISSSQEIKYDITALTNSLSPSVNSDRVSQVATVDPTAILDVAVAEFSVVDDGEPTDRRVLGFIADDVADKLPIAVTRYEDGKPAGVLDTSLLAALLAVVQGQAATIEDLRARIEALEA